MAVWSKENNRTCKVYIFFFRKCFKKIKTIKDEGEEQIKALEEHGKQLFKYSDEK